MAAITLDDASSTMTIVATGTIQLDAQATTSTAVVTATPVSGGAMLTLGTVVNQPGPFSISATVPPGQYTVVATLSEAITVGATATVG
ncbi:MAG TPA: hypothetical protein VL614_18120 [Acetobacteraceae bacterium]|jgi:hypothetical protein|nr:hypothetical protein [Acetobacteraceae bacterium]